MTEGTAMPLADWIRPNRPARSAYEPRPSDAMGELGSYRIRYDGWTHASLPGDPVLDWTGSLRRRDAIRVSQAIIDIAPQRADIAARMLEREGLHPCRSAHEWGAIEQHLIALAEPSAEPRDALLQGAIMRPAYRAFLVDVGLLYVRRAIALRPDLRLVRADEGRDGRPAWLSAFPRLIDGHGVFKLAPIETVLIFGVGAIKGKPHLGKLATYLGALSDLEDGHDIRSFWDGFARRHGRFATGEELAEFIVTNGFDAGDIPDDIARLAGCL